MSVINVLVIVCMSVLPFQAFPSSSVGHGGFVERELVNESVFLLNDLIALIEKDIAVERAKETPEKRASEETYKLPCVNELFDEAQHADCAKFLDAALPQFKHMISPKGMIPIDISEEDLKDHEGRSVDAICTEHAPQDPVVFSLHSLKFMAPERLFFLLVHELGHKVLYGHGYVEDEAPFLTFEHGHQLLDTIARTLVTLAQQKKLIVAERFEIFDWFDCVVTVEGLRWTWEMGGVSFRRLENREKNGYDYYHTRIDGQFYDFKWPDPGLGEKILMRANIVESNGCRENARRRETVAQIIRATTDEVLVEERFPFNPICGDKSEKIKLSYSSSTIECGYVRSYSFAGALELIDLKNAITKRDNRSKQYVRAGRR